MCGIAGGIALGADARVDARRVSRMTALLAHRGPDAQGHWESPGGLAAFGHRRLSVIDVTGGGQPMHDPGGRFSIVFNGEIYNYRELRRELARDGVAFRTESDTEVLLHLFIRHGEGCLSRLTGMFAFAVWDDVRRELFLARDRVGEKPLYYALEADCLYFASSFSAIHRTGRLPARVDTAALDRFLDLGYVPAPHTIVSGVSKLAAGTFLRAGPSHCRVERYWDPSEPAEPFEGTFERAVDRLDELLNESVALRLRSDVPLGIFLSGGIDSSLVAAVAARHVPHPVSTFSIAFDERGYDESGYAAAVAGRIGSEHHTFRSTAEVLELVPEVVRHYGEPFADPSALPTWLLARETRKHVTVALGGDGGDEGFGGYNWYHTAARLHRFRALVPPVLAAAGVRALDRAGSGSKVAGRLQRGASLLALSPADRFASLRSFVGPRDAGRLYAGELAATRAALPDSGRGQLADLFARAGGSDLRRMRVVDVATYLADCLMPKVDVATMASGLEARSPLLDHQVVAFGLSLPDPWLIDGKGGKRILRAVLERYLPLELFERPKQGFSVPLERWFGSGVRGPVSGLARSAALRDTGWFRTDGIAALVREHADGRRDHSQRLYNLLVLDQWLAQQ